MNARGQGRSIAPKATASRRCAVFAGATKRGGDPDQGGEVPDPAFDPAAYRERNVVERLINRLKPCRRIATRYEKRACNYRAMAILAAILIWL